MKKRFLQLLFIATTATLTFSSCSKDDDTQVNNSEKTEIRLSSGITTHLRSSRQNTQIAAGQKVGFFVEDAGAPTSIIYTNTELTADGNGALNYSPKMFYPTNGNTVNFYAYHPFGSASDLTTAIPFSVKADQTAATDYLNSDLLYSQKTGVARTSSAELLTFNHKLSKLTFTVKKGEGASLEGLSAIEIQNTLPETSLKLEDGTITAASGTATTIKAFGVPTTVSSTDAEVSGMAAIVVPQTVTTDTELLKITIGGVSYIYRVPANLDYESGKVYNYTITVNMAGIIVTSEIVDWVNGGDIDGDGTID